MLKTTVSKTISGTSVIDNAMVASMTATISEEGNISISKNVYNKDLYNQNKAAVQKDMADFETGIFKEDE
ncbi:putative uncharacterized protein [Clostridium sp. CAG:590]|jgi:hypothetical protein|nr:putative uncharacterized protein [Clostridium sp. CAG:590]